MNGIEAIEFMRKGNLVITQETLVYGIFEGVVKFKIVKGHFSSNEFEVSKAFELNSVYEEYIEPKELNGWERVNYSHSYFFISGDGSVGKDCEVHMGVDKNYHNIANYFSTKEKAKEISFKQTLFRKLQRFSDENGGDEIDWNDNDEDKWSIVFDHHRQDLIPMSHHRFGELGGVYFNSGETTQQAIELFHDDLIKCFTMLAK